MYLPIQEYGGVGRRGLCGVQTNQCMYTLHEYICTLYEYICTLHEYICTLHEYICTFMKDLTCKRGSVGHSEGLLIPRSSLRFRLNPENSNWHGSEVHRP